MSFVFYAFREILGQEAYPLDWEVAGHSVCYIYLLAAPYFFLVLVLEYAGEGGSGGILGRLLRSCQSYFTKLSLRWHGIHTSTDEDGNHYSLLGDDDSKLSDDEDVARERHHVLKNKEELRHTEPVVLLNLWKIYPPSVGMIGSLLLTVRRFFASTFCLFCNSGALTACEEKEEEKPFVPKQAVRGVSTAIKKGETYALLGQNGA
jgi:hypothetical protein